MFRFLSTYEINNKLGYTYVDNWLHTSAVIHVYKARARRNGYMMFILVYIMFILVYVLCEWPVFKSDSSYTVGGTLYAT